MIEEPLKDVTEDSVPGHHQRIWESLSFTETLRFAAWMWGWVAVAFLALTTTACGAHREVELRITETTRVNVSLTPSSTPIPPSPTPSPTVTPTPTLTSVPTLRFHLPWPARVSPLEPIPVAVTFDSPPVGARLSVSATVLQPDGESYAVFKLAPDADDEGSGSARYVASEPLQLPLIPASEPWWLVAHIDAPYPLKGLRVRSFIAETPPLHDLAGGFPDGVTIQVPEAFETVIEIGRAHV